MRQNNEVRFREAKSIRANTATPRLISATHIAERSRILNLLLPTTSKESSPPAPVLEED